MAAKLKQEVVVLDQRLAEIDVNIAALKKKVRETPDKVGKKMAFMQMKNLQKQAVRFTRLYQICSSMEDDVREQAIMKNTSSVLQEFVNHHEELIKDSSMQKLIEGYEKIQANVEDITDNVGVLSEVLRATTMMGDPDNDEDDLEKQLEEFLAEDESLDAVPTVSANKHVPLPPETQTIRTTSREPTEPTTEQTTEPVTTTGVSGVSAAFPSVPEKTKIEEEEEEEARRRAFAAAFEDATPEDEENGENGENGENERDEKRALVGA